MSEPTQGYPLIGVGLAVGTVALFALGDTITKALALRHPVEQIGAVRFWVGMVLLLVFIAPRAGARLWRAQRLWLVIARGVTLSAMTLVMGYALRLMPVGETIAIMYLAPFAVMILASPLLGERVNALGWGLAILGFAGVLVIVRPGGALDPAGVALALVLAAGNTAFHLLTRFAARTETALTMIFYVTAVGCALFTAAAIPTLGGTIPGLVDLALMAALGVIFTFGHFLFAVAYRHAPATLIAPVNYMHFVWAGLLGWAAFGHVPDGLTMLGMGLILTAGVALALKAHHETRRSRRAAPA